MAEVTIIQSDLVDQSVDVIVNAWNRNFIPWWLLVPQGVARAIRKRAGIQPFREIGRCGLLRSGEARLTSAGRLPQKAIIHVAAITWYWRSTLTIVRQSVRNAMALAQEQGFGSIAFPILGSGTGGLSVQDAMQAMVDEFDKIESNILVTIVQYNKSKAAT